MKGMRWKAVCLPVLLAVLLASTAGADPTLYIDPPVTAVFTGEDFWVDVSVNAELLGLTGYDLTIDYDENVLEVLGVVEGALPQSSGESFFYWTSGPPPANAIVINGAVLGGSVDGPGVLARLHFSALGPVWSPLEFLTFELRDIENTPIPVIAVDGQVVISDPPTIYLTPQTTQVVEGTMFSIDVAVNESLTDLTGYDLRITLDSSIVHYVGATEGPLPSSGGDDTYFFWILEDDDTLIINGAVLGSWVNGPGVLAHITLFALSPGTTDMEFLSVELRDIDNNPLTALDEGAVIIVEEGGSPVDDTSWSVVKSLYR
ncbi:hypothetical protein KAW64_01925 [bacterium]|nr:hypothetical protein [bacterium]